MMRLIVFPLMEKNWRRWLKLCWSKVKKSVSFETSLSMIRDWKLSYIEHRQFNYNDVSSTFKRVRINLLVAFYLCVKMTRILKVYSHWRRAAITEMLSPHFLLILYDFPCTRKKLKNSTFLPHRDSIFMNAAKMQWEIHILILVGFHQGKLAWTRVSSSCYAEKDADVNI